MEVLACRGRPKTPEAFRRNVCSRGLSGLRLMFVSNSSTCVLTDRRLIFSIVTILMIRVFLLVPYGTTGDGGIDC